MSYKHFPECFAINFVKFASFIKLVALLPVGKNKTNLITFMQHHAHIAQELYAIFDVMQLVSDNASSY